MLNATLGALGRGEAAPPTPAPAPALSPAPPTGQASQSLPSQLARLAHVEADVEARLVRVEAAVEEAQEAVGEMQELRRAAKVGSQVYNLFLSIIASLRPCALVSK